MPLNEMFKCPHCGEEFSESAIREWQIEVAKDLETPFSVWCDECDKEITILPHLRITYTIKD